MFGGAISQASSDTGRTRFDGRAALRRLLIARSHSTVSLSGGLPRPPPASSPPLSVRPNKTEAFICSQPLLRRKRPRRGLRVPAVHRHQRRRRAVPVSRRLSSRQSGLVSLVTATPSVTARAPPPHVTRGKMQTTMTDFMGQSFDRDVPSLAFRRQLRGGAGLQLLHEATPAAPLVSFVLCPALSG
ncbi:hypothetical protein E2C01_065482 [Portunus trituberculatus]|uniref:Uncharacterized protein n=1 Tax=Portunus trituberculatus TaxID=210409 RepID=A0A5B7HFP9_PORTR|nr:hypothetical protein [Portunus trituberculatus]